jgi:hypothetical protein
MKKLKSTVLASDQFSIETMSAKTHRIDISITQGFLPQPGLQRFDRSAVNINLGMNADVSVFTHLFTLELV